MSTAKRCALRNKTKQWILKCGTDGSSLQLNLQALQTAPIFSRLAGLPALQLFPVTANPQPTYRSQKLLTPCDHQDYNDGNCITVFTGIVSGFDCTCLRDARSIALEGMHIPNADFLNMWPLELHISSLGLHSYEQQILLLRRRQWRFGSWSFSGCILWVTSFF